MNKPILMIHEINKEYLQKKYIRWEDFILTFDDCLFSQYYYWEFFQNLKTEKILFIPCELINNFPRRDQFRLEYMNFPTCEESFLKRKSNPENYMSLNEIEHIIDCTPDLILGGHGFSHIRLEGTKIEKINCFKNDVIKMINWFRRKFRLNLRYYCYPFNEEIPLGDIILKAYGIDKVFGKDRIDVREIP